MSTAMGVESLSFLAKSGALFFGIGYGAVRTGEKEDTYMSEEEDTCMSEEDTCMSFGIGYGAIRTGVQTLNLIPNPFPGEPLSLRPYFPNPNPLKP